MPQPYSDSLSLWYLAKQGRIFIAGDADQNDTVTGQTSFANTTPTFLIDVPASTIVVPMYADLSQAGLVAGGDITLIIEIDNADRYGSSGTDETTILNSNVNHTRTPLAKIYSNPTANAGTGQRVFSALIAPDVSPAEGILPGPLWTPVVPLILEGPAAFLIYTYAGTTGPTWLWTICWAELPAGDVTL